MKLICVDNKNGDYYETILENSGLTPSLTPIYNRYYNLTIGKSYEMLITHPSSAFYPGGFALIKTQDDLGHVRFFPKHCFKSLDEIRDEKINTILDGKYEINLC
jgi:hypothetical protein